MSKEFSSIMELKAIRKEKSRLSEREAELAAPKYKDVSLIPTVYSWFQEFIPADCKDDSVTLRRKFLFIAMYLFAPSALAGGRMPKGVRAELSKIFSEVTPCVLSNNLTDMLFTYQQYKGFRTDIENIYNRIVERMKQKEKPEA